MPPSCAARMRMRWFLASTPRRRAPCRASPRVFTLDDLAPVMNQRRMNRVSNSGTKLDQSWCFALANGEVSLRGRAGRDRARRSRYVAEDAAALVEVDYDLLPAATDPRAVGRAPGVRRELASNAVITYKVGYGDSEAAFAKAAHVFRQELWHASRRRALDGGPRHPGADRRPRDRRLGLDAKGARSAQRARRLHRSRREPGCGWRPPDVGGGFGPKLCVYPEDVAVVAAATLLRRSVKWIEDRREHFTNAAQERDQYLVDRDRGRCRRAGARHARPAACTISAPMRCRT